MQSLQVGNENFDLWLKLAKDNKINSRNSWEVALIDYFYDLSLLKEGDQINFQKASATLDGCVKIYSSRIDSAATETGKLLSGLSSAKRLPGEEAAEEENENDVEDEARPKKKCSNALNVNTLVDVFSKIQLKELDSELTIDPVFRKALADFDEGGSKSLLFNILHVNEDGRVVFDASRTEKVESIGDYSMIAEDEDEIEDEDENDEKEKEINNDDDLMKSMEFQDNSKQVDFLEEHIQDLALYFTTLQNHDLGSLSVCSSLPVIEDMLNDLDMKANEMFERIEGENDPNQSFNYDAINQEVAAQQPETTVADIDQGSFLDFALDEPMEDNLDRDYDSDDIVDSILNVGHRTMRNLFKEPSFDLVEEVPNEKDIDFGNLLIDRNLIDFFDSNSKKTWAGPENWKVTNLKKKLTGGNAGMSPEEIEAKKQRRAKKKLFLIDFASVIDEDDRDNALFEEKYFTDLSTIQNASTSQMLPKNQRASATHHLLPFDKQYNSKRFITLFYKEEYINSSFLKRKKKNNEGIPEIHEFDDLASHSFFLQDNQYENDDIEPRGEEDGPIPTHKDFFADIPDLGPPKEKLSTLLPPYSPFRSPGASPGRYRDLNNMIAYARKAKRVDIKVLKDKLWESLKENKELRFRSENEPRNSLSQQEELPQDEDSIDPDSLLTNPFLESFTEQTENMTKVGQAKFSDIVKATNNKYDPSDGARNDISCSFYFICLLHLANEQKFAIESQDDLEDLVITRPALQDTH